MGRVLIACETLKDEIEKVIETLALSIPICWMGNSLHSAPEQLREKLQSTLDGMTGYDEILLGYGNCGNGLVGLCSHNATLVVPKFADCIDMLLSDNHTLDKARHNTYFLTKGWLRGESPLMDSWRYQLRRYGKEQSKKIMRVLYRNYTHLMMIKTGTYELSEIQDEIDEFTAMTDLKLIQGEGSLTILQKLLTGQWDEDFCIIDRGRATTIDDFLAVK